MTATPRLVPHSSRTTSAPPDRADLHHSHVPHSASAVWRQRDCEDLVLRHADNPSAFLAFNRGTRHFRSPGVDGLVAYRATRGYLVLIGGVLAAEQDRPALLKSFEQYARASGRRVMAVQLMVEQATLFARHGYRVNQFGSSYSINLSAWDTSGGDMRKTRGMVRRAARDGVHMVEAGSDHPGGAELDRELDTLDAAWLGPGGKEAGALQFMVGERGRSGHGPRRLFLALQEGRAVGYLSLSPAGGNQPGYLVDLLRRLPDAPPGVVEMLLCGVLQRLQEQGCAYAHLGLTPFTGLADEHEQSARSWLAGRAIRLLAEHGGRIYPVASQIQWKQKWRPDIVQPEYLAMPGRFRLRGVLQLLRLTGAL